MQRTRRCLGLVAATALGLSMLGLGLAAPPASAEGGNSIASAPVVPYGQQMFGNTATGAADTNECYRSFWEVNVTAGDELTVDWESKSEHTELILKPVGTTDFTFLDNENAASDYPDSNGKSELTYTAPQSGLMPMYFRSCYGLQSTGPYAFTANVKHAVFTSLTPRTNIRPTATLTGSATLAGGAPVPDGLVFTLTASWRGNGSAQFTASSVGGGLSFPVSLPPTAERQITKFEINRPADGSFLATNSGAIEVHVGRAVSSSPRAHHHTRHCRRGFHKRRVHHKVRCVRIHHR
jgi:hypothetical protein